MHLNILSLIYYHEELHTLLSSVKLNLKFLQFQKAESYNLFLTLAFRITHMSTAQQKQQQEGLSYI